MLQNFQSWLQAPFQANMSAAGWFLFFGMILIIAMLWHMILVGFGAAVRSA